MLQFVPRAATLAPLAVTAFVCATLKTAVARPGDTDPTSDHISRLAGEYGFQSMVLSKLGDGISNLTAGDVDGDGRGDLAVVQNSRSKIELLVVPAAGERAGDGKSGSEKQNELSDETFFRRESLPVEEKVTALAIADVAGDAVPEILYLGDSGKLTIATRRGRGDYATLQRIEIEEPSASAMAIQVVSLAPTQRALLVLGTNATQIFRPTAAGRYELDLSLPNATRNADQFHVTDLDGDGNHDLVYVVLDSEWPVRFRLGGPVRDGRLDFGPELTSRFASMRAIQFRDVDGEKGTEAIGIRSKSGRLAMLRFAAQGQGSEGALSALRSIPFRPLKDADQREFVLLEGKGHEPMVLVAEPSAAQVSVFGGLLHGGGAPRVAASLSQVARPHLADVDGDGVAELVIASTAERVIGISRLKDGVLEFPRALPIPEGGDMLALDAADLDGDGKAEISLLVAEGKGKDRKGRVLELDANGTPVRDSWEIGKLSKDPTDVWRIDLDRDGHLDAVLFVARDLPRILLAGKDGKGFEEVKVEERGLGILNGLERGQLAFGDVDRDGKSELLVPRGNFVRAIYLDATRMPVTVLQCNLDDPTAQVKRVALIDLDGSGPSELAIHDEKSGRLEVWRADGKTSERLARVDLGGVVPTFLAGCDLDADGKQDLVVGAPDRLAVVKNAAADPGFVSVADLEIPLKNAFPDRLALGEVNGDGTLDVVATESVDHQMLFVAIRKDALEYALRFKVFETRIFESQRGGREPREVVVADVTGDQKQDVAIVVHDRVIVYPQE